MTAYHYDKQPLTQKILQSLSKQLLYCFPLLLVSISVPFLSIYGVLIPENEQLSAWFQRSGSLSVLFAALTEYKLFKLHGHFYPTGLLPEDAYRFRQKYGAIYTSYNILAAVMVLVGTFIWGYGDLFV